ncbi:hypothetical protein OKA04_04480 [Luteolibacter flavescens]|uniref:HEAT repeat domain-containing protein n=1 Tax=Luteolibacter flavescens TaxID=1859460 RepID=A0ABT3FKJ3_9BACT|nr:hypothetical protein [Luteolibacter flavescens]MCW1883972.1 hypothetical protein [Luteolibacter flavescens]
MTDREEAALETLRQHATGSGAVRKSLWPWSRGRNDPDHAGGHLERAVALLSAADPAEAIPKIAPIVWAYSATLGEALSRLILSLAGRLPSGAWPRVDEWMRLTLGGYWEAVDLPSRADPGVVLVALCHPSGRVREKAIHLHGLLPPAIAASLLLVRINDWVGQVRYSSELKLDPLLRSLDPQQKMELVPLVHRLRGCGRHDKAMALDGWLRSLTMPFHEEAWLAAWHRSDTRGRHVYLTVLKSSGIPPSRAIRDALLKSNDRMALLWYLKGILPTLEGADREEATEAMSRSRAVPLRRAWIDHLLEGNPQRAIPLLMDMLIDRSRSLRHHARYHLGKLAPLDFAAHYTALLDWPELEEAALCGLAEVSPADAHRKALPLLSSSNPRVRKVAVESLEKDLLADHLPALLELSVDPEPGPSKAARGRLLEIAYEVGAHLLSTPDTTAGFPAALQIQLIRIAPFFSKWQGLEYLLRQRIDGAARREVTAALRHWMQREGQSYVNLKADRRVTLLKLTDQADLGLEVAKEIRFILERAE